jgi:hypothetical protein
MISKTYKKLIAKQFAQDFKSAIEIIELPIPEPAPDEIVIRNKFGVKVAKLSPAATRRL